VFNMDIEACTKCGGTAKVIACMEDPVVIEKIHTHLKAKSVPELPNLLPSVRAPLTVSVDITSLVQHGMLCSPGRGRVSVGLRSGMGGKWRWRGQIFRWRGQNGAGLGGVRRDAWPFVTRDLMVDWWLTCAGKGCSFFLNPAKKILQFRTPCRRIST
jgi:hypothetical protein